MDVNDVRKRLRAAEKAIQRALESLDTMYPDESIERVPVAHCPICDKIIYNTDATTRQRHRHCFDVVYNMFVRSKYTTLKVLQQRGIIGEKGEPGRKGRGESIMTLNIRGKEEATRVNEAIEQLKSEMTHFYARNKAPNDRSEPVAKSMSQGKQALKRTRSKNSK